MSYEFFSPLLIILYTEELGSMETLKIINNKQYHLICI
jgi:hypothetical protein